MMNNWHVPLDLGKLYRRDPPEKIIQGIPRKIPLDYHYLALCLYQLTEAGMRGEF
jgi:hypothetical protein